MKHSLKSDPDGEHLSDLVKASIVVPVLAFFYVPLTYNTTARIVHVNDHRRIQWVMKQLKS